MAQSRYNSYGRALVSFDEDRRTIGLAIPGVYCGWDTLALTGANGISLGHTKTGVKATKSTNASQDGPLGLVVSNHGVEIYEDDVIPLSIDYNAANAFVRVDWIIASHFYVASVGGSPAVYSVVKGPNGVNYGEPASLPDPNTQVLIGKIYIPASATSLSGLAWVRQQNPKLGGYGFNQLSETDINDGNSGESVINDLNLVKKTGFYHFSNNPSNPPITGRKWNILVMKRTTYVTQLASDTNSGKVYSRNSANTGSTWSPWVNLNNPDVLVDFTPITNQIGTRVYTEDNYVADGQTVTQSIDALDMEMRDIADELVNAETDIDNLTTAVAARALLVDPNAWINLPLGAGVTAFSNVPQYRMNQFSKIELRGYCTFSITIGSASNTLDIDLVTALPVAIHNAMAANSYLVIKTIIIPTVVAISSTIPAPARLAISAISDKILLTIGDGHSTGFPAATYANIFLSLDGLSAQLT